MSEPLIAVVDHDATFQSLVERLLRSAGYRALVCDEKDASEQIREAKPDAVMIDTWLERREGGWAVLQNLWLDEATAKIPVLLCTDDKSGFEERAATLRGKRIGVVYKPFDPEQLLASLGELLHDSRDGHRGLEEAADRVPGAAD
jgi:DNA-binding response OmpR family regulator